MLRKIFKTGNSVVVSLPKDIIEYLDMDEGTEVKSSRAILVIVIIVNKIIVNQRANSLR